MDKINFNITAAAKDRIIELLSQEKRGEFLRLSIVGGGCSGFSYSFTLDTALSEDDCVWTLDDPYKVAIDLMSAQYLEGATLDYFESAFDSHFKVENPNAVSSCGCGSSFSI